MNDMPGEIATTLDATGLLCPLPVLKARRALKPLAPGAVLEVLATDPGAVKDFEHFCQTTGCELLEFIARAGRRPALSAAQAGVTSPRDRTTLPRGCALPVRPEPHRR